MSLVYTGSQERQIHWKNHWILVYSKTRCSESDQRTFGIGALTLAKVVSKLLPNSDLTLEQVLKATPNHNQWIEVFGMLLGNF